MNRPWKRNCTTKWNHSVAIRCQRATTTLSSTRRILSTTPRQQLLSCWISLRRRSWCINWTTTAEIISRLSTLAKRAAAIMSVHLRYLSVKVNRTYCSLSMKTPSSKTLTSLLRRWNRALIKTPRDPCRWAWIRIPIKLSSSSTWLSLSLIPRLQRPLLVILSNSKIWQIFSLSHPRTPK